MSNYDTGMPTNYDSGVAQSAGGGGKVDHAFVRTIKGILRIVEFIVALIAFICCAVGRRGNKGAGAWCMFVSMFSFLIFLITFFLWLFKVFSNVRFPVRFMEFVIYVTFGCLYLIAAIVAAAFGNRHPGLGAGAFFLFVMVALCVVDGFFHYRYWFSSEEGPYICGKAGTGGGAASAAPPTNTGGTVDSRGPTY